MTTPSPSWPLFLALDVGGTKLAAGVVDHGGGVRSFLTAPSDVARGPMPMMRDLFELGHAALTRLGLTSQQVAAVGVSCGGPLDPERGVVYGPPPNLPGWLRVPVTELTEQEFGRPAVLCNDASASTLAEYRFGGWRVNVLAYVTISTGLGGGVVAGGKLWAGSAGNGGEPGHIPLDWRGRLCPCGGRGCAEAYLSGTSIAARARERVAALNGDGTTSVLAGCPSLTARDVSRAAGDGDRLASQLWSETVELMAAWLTGLVNIWEPDLLVLGGGVTNAGTDLLLAPLRDRVDRLVTPVVARPVRLEFSRFGPHSGLLGAAAAAMVGRAGVRDVLESGVA